MPFLADGTPIDIILNPIGVPSRMNIGQVMETHLGWAADTLGFRAITPVFDGADEIAIQDALGRAWIATSAQAVSLAPEKTDHDFDLEKAKSWVNEKGYKGEGVFDVKARGYAREICLRIWLEAMGIPSQDIKASELAAVADRIGAEKKQPPPIIGKAILRDGRTGETLDNAVTVGQIYMLKLNHLVEDKVHARSTGPYSLISQQPLGGKAQFGGQRFGEMEVWTLEAYGAARNLQEILTIKSDDVTGRAKTYEAIVKDTDILQPGVPESFKVLVKELQSLSLSVEVYNEGKATPAREITDTESTESALLEKEVPTFLPIDTIKRESEEDEDAGG
jgi:DNA-directed RNA polymerase subunit beta